MISFRSKLFIISYIFLDKTNCKLRKKSLEVFF